MKRHLGRFLFAFLLGWILFFQIDEPSRSLLIPWQIIYTTHDHGSQLVGSFTLSQQWTVTWRCTSSSSSSLWTLQIADHQGHTQQETMPCNSNVRRLPFQEPGSFYFAVTTEGEWMLQLEEKRIEYEVARPYRITYIASYQQYKAHKVMLF